MHVGFNVIASDLEWDPDRTKRVPVLAGFLNSTKLKSNGIIQDHIKWELVIVNY